MTANRITPVVVAGMMLAAAISSSSQAGEHRYYGRWHSASAPANTFVFNRDPAAFISKSGVFSVTFDVVRNASRSIYLLRSYQPTAFIGPVLSGETQYVAPKAKIIDVTSELRGAALAPFNGCSWESGVCVIRGGR